MALAADPLQRQRRALLVQAPAGDERDAMAVGDQQLQQPDQAQRARVAIGGRGGGGDDEDRQGSIATGGQRREGHPSRWSAPRRRPLRRGASGGQRGGGAPRAHGAG